MADIELVVKIPEEKYKWIKENNPKADKNSFVGIIVHGKPLPKGHGRIGDLDELEQRINNFVEHDAHLIDKYTVVRQRFIVDGIRETPTIIEADKESE